MLVVTLAAMVMMMTTAVMVMTMLLLLILLMATPLGWCCRLCRRHPSALCPTLGTVTGAMAGGDEFS